jgi:hypothetical protein
VCVSGSKTGCALSLICAESCCCTFSTPAAECARSFNDIFRLVYVSDGLRQTGWPYGMRLDSDLTDSCDCRPHCMPVDRVERSRIARLRALVGGDDARGVHAVLMISTEEGIVMRRMDSSRFCSRVLFDALFRLVRPLPPFWPGLTALAVPTLCHPPQSP